jgi:hypothetical protein
MSGPLVKEPLWGQVRILAAMYRYLQTQFRQAVKNPYGLLYAVAGTTKIGSPALD